MSDHEAPEESPTGKALPTSPWSRPGDDLSRELGSDPSQGLTEAEARERLERYGPNRLQEHAKRSAWAIALQQVRSPIIWLLGAAVVAALVMQEYVDAIAVGVALLLNTVIGFFVEWRAVRSMEALRRLGEVAARVVRDGREARRPAEALVPGDLVLLREGDVVPADLRILDADTLGVDESALTGESVPVEKSPEPVEADAPLAERLGMLFKGTVVTRGEARALVVGTAMETEIGAISRMVEESAEQQVPLDRRLADLGRRLVWVVLVMAAAVGIVGLLAGRETEAMVKMAVALAIAAIPEGLPIVATMALARGMWRMLRRNALIRQLSSVETLGATTVICVDKTGTLTENRMEVRRLALADGRMVDVTTGDDAHLEIDGRRVDPAEDEVLRAALDAAVLANEAELDSAGGDPMERALLRMGRDLGRPRQGLIEVRPEARVEPFNRETRMIATFHEAGGSLEIAVKGAPGAVLAACTRVAGGALDDDTRQAWEERNLALAGDGLRILGLATGRVDAPDADADPYRDLTFLGLVGLLDPPRAGVRGALEDCRNAGIRVVMVTGDQPATARNIGERLGLIEAGDDVRVVNGDDLGDPDEASEELRSRVVRAEILARVTPKQKVALVEWLRDDNQIVAMTGDGVNDAPALRKAHIGIAMGERGTDVARQAADMVLEDDAFVTIRHAVEQGRIILGNIRKFLVYLFSGNVGEIAAVAAAAAVGLPLPLLPLQILYLNIINDVFPALALGVGPGTGDVMKEQPRPADEPLMTRGHWIVTVAYGLVIGSALLAAFVVAAYVFDLSPRESLTVSFLTISLSRLLHVFNMRDHRSGLVVNDVSRNPWIWAALATSTALLGLAIGVPAVAEVLSLTVPSATGWLLIAGFSLAPLVLGQAALLLLGSRRPAAPAQEDQRDEA